MCLSAYEVIAPQVIDQNIRSILRIASRVNQLGSLNSQGISENVPTFSNTILHEFLVNLITRLGRSNQVIVLLDAIVCCAADEQNAESDGNGVTAEGLLGIFRHAGVQAALLEACNVCLNPECLLLRVLSYVSPWASADDGDARDKESNELSRAKGADGDDAAVQVGVGLCRLTPGGVLFLLEIVSSVLRGVTPTSISASAVLEQVTELELVLSAFLVNGLFKAFFTEGGDGGTEESQVPIEQRSAVEVSAHRSVRSSLFACANNAVRPKVRRHLVFGALSAIHNARALILSCLQDLGVSDLEGYLHLLEDSMWHLRHQIDAIVGPLTADDLSAAVSLSAQIRYALSTKCLPIVPLLALQRLTLARYVAVTLGIDVGPVAAARKLSALALSYMCGEGEGGLMSNGEVDLALLLANTLVEEEWSSVAYFARPRRFRSTVVWLLQASFAQAGNPAWLSRSMTACGGLVLEALSSVLLDISDAKIMACCNVLHSKNADDDTGDEGANDASLLRLFAALNDILCRLGHVAQWHNIMQRIVHWLLMIEKDRKNANSEPCQIQGYLLRLVLNFLSCEENAQLVFRWALIQGNERQMQESHQHDRQRGRKGGHGTKLVNEAFMEAVKMPFTLTDITLYDRNNSVAKENEENTDAVRLETVKEAIDTCTTLVQQLFSKKFIGLLLQSCCETQEVSATTLSFKYAAGILGKLYSTALAVSRNNRTSSGDSSPAQEFVLNVVDKMHKCCSVGNYVPLSVFFYEISGNVLAPSPPRRQVICRVNNDTRRTNEEEGHSVKGTEEVDGGEVRSGRSFASAGEVVGNKRPREEDAENVAVKKWAAEPQVGDVALRWVKLLRDLLEQVVEQLVNEQNPPQSLLPLLHSTTSLYMALERVQVTLPHPTQRTGEHMSRGEMKVKGGSANDQRLAAFAVASQLSPETVCQLRKLFAPSKSGSRRRSATVLLPLLSSHNDSVIRTVWVLYSAYEESRRQNGCNGEEAVLTGDSLSISWFATLLGSLNPHVFDVDSGFKLDGLESVLEELKQVVTREHSEHVPLRLTNLHREGPHNTEEATVWLLGQLHAAPMILRTFSASHAQPLLMEYVHALFHAVVSSPGPMPQSPNCFWGRRQRLLTAVAIALQRVSAIPCMRFAMWRNDVKRLLVAAGSAVVSADTGIRSSRELTNSMIFRVLQLCTLHLAALHDDDAFVDHQLSFVTTVLFNGSGGFYDGNLCLPELVILQILRLLSSTLLTRGVLWRRAHLMPALLSALLTRCLDGVSRGDCTRVVLNQLSSFLFQLVKDKNYGLSRDVSAPLKSLCLSSLTSCLFRQAAAYIDVFTTHSSDLDYIAADLLKSLQHNHLPPRRTPSVLKKWKRECVENEEDRDAANTSDATLCDLSYACVGNGDAQLLLRQAAERVDEEEGTGGRHIFLLPE
uniref:WGS project CAEQ00000000 data, annotated contig 453 n=1 Tax=Trypanosoma congolense (strain IL3000) TaxID=1068625 RepID=F9WG20_TRYCI|nr:unnamed protein product [Trypanosoma congolense IL3000]